MQDFLRLLEISVLGNSLLAWTQALGVLIAAFLALLLVRRFLVRRVSRLKAAVKLHWLELAVELLGHTRTWFLFLMAVFVASLPLELTPRIEVALESVVSLVLILQLGLWANFALRQWLERVRESRLKQDPASATALSALGFAGRVVLWSALLLLALDNLGFDITAVVAGLGVGGIAVALAVQTILGDLFASLSIVLDRPFSVGDFIIVDDLLGNVEYVGLKTTRVRSLSGEQLVFSNSDLLNSRIRNYGRMYERRVVFHVGVIFQTPLEQLKAIPEILREAVERNEQVRFDRAHFQKYGDFSLNYEIVYYVLSPEYNVYMDIQQAINLRIFERFAEEGIEFAYPTRTLFLAKESEEPSN